MGNSVVQKKIIAKVFDESTKIKTLSKSFFDAASPSTS